MLGEKGTIFVEAKTAAAARSGKTFELFKASAILMENTGAGDYEEVVSIDGTTNAKEFDVANLQSVGVTVGDLLTVTKTIQGFFVTATAPAIGGMIQFEFDDDDYSEEVPSDCASRSSGGYNLRVRVINAPCGGGVLGMDEEGYVTVSDPGGFLIRRDPRDLPGRTGFAQLMNAESDYGEPCGWVITWINFFRETIVVHDVIFQANKIILKRKKIMVWDSCQLAPEEILGADCDPEDEYI